MDPNAGSETVYLQTIDHPEEFEVEYLRTPEEGPILYEQNAWVLLWFLPVNQPDLGLWLKENIPDGAEAANVRSSFKTPWYGYFLFVPTIGLVRVERIRFQFDPVTVEFVPDETTVDS